VEDGETLDEAAVRETGEETGFEIGVVGPPLFTRSFQWVFEGSAYDQEETYFLVRVSRNPRRTGDGAKWRRPDRR
jgi:8-oxo-dGTP pyrophosphatase MutT (NUDIX family)